MTLAAWIVFLKCLQCLWLVVESLFSPQRGAPSAASLRGGHVSSLSSLEQENHQLRQELAKMRSQLYALNPACQEKYERALLSHAMADRPQLDQDGSSQNSSSPDCCETLSLQVSGAGERHSL